MKSIWLVNELNIRFPAIVLQIRASTKKSYRSELEYLPYNQIRNKNLIFQLCLTYLILLINIFYPKPMELSSTVTTFSHNFLNWAVVAQP